MTSFDLIADSLQHFVATMNVHAGGRPVSIGVPRAVMDRLHAVATAADPNFRPKSGAEFFLKDVRFFVEERRP